jgi:glycosyltransferase involved in cell wall biosynthesis
MFPGIENNKQIKIITENYTKKQLNDLYNECDVYVSPTRAEAFNLPCLEAMSCGKPVITTNFGGQTDFCDNSTGILIDYDLVEQKDLEYEGIKWATPKH